MFVAKLPGSMYATHATNAGPMNGSSRNRVVAAEDSLARPGDPGQSLGPRRHHSKLA